MWKWPSRMSLGATPPSRHAAQFEAKFDDRVVPRIHAAAFWLLDTPLRIEDGENSPVAEMALSLLSHAKSPIDDLASDEAEDHVDASFILCICNVLTSHLRISFENAANFALIRHLSGAGIPAHPERTGRKIGEVTAFYNFLIEKKPDIPKMVFAALRKFLKEPNAANRENFSELYQLIYNHVEPYASQLDDD
jgi:hypothetical protein